MNKTELIGEVAKKAGLTKKDTEKVISSFIDVVQESLSGGDTVSYSWVWYVPGKREACSGRPQSTDRRANSNTCCKGSGFPARQRFEGCCERPGQVAAVGRD